MPSLNSFFFAFYHIWSFFQSPFADSSYSFCSILFIHSFLLCLFSVRSFLHFFASLRVSFFHSIFLSLILSLFFTYSFLFFSSHLCSLSFWRIQIGFLQKQQMRTLDQDLICVHRIRPEPYVTESPAWWKLVWNGKWTVIVVRSWNWEAILSILLSSLQRRTSLPLLKTRK